MPYDKKQKLKIKKHVNEINILQRKSVLRIFLNHDEKLIIFNNYYLGFFFPNIPHNRCPLQVSKTYLSPHNTPLDGAFKCNQCNLRYKTRDKDANPTAILIELKTAQWRNNKTTHTISKQMEKGALNSSNNSNKMQNPWKDKKQTSVLVPEVAEKAKLWMTMMIGKTACFCRFQVMHVKRYMLFDFCLQMNAFIRRSTFMQ